MDTLLSISYNCTGSVPKNRQILPWARAVQARQSFNLQQITETLKIIIFLLNICRNVQFTSKNNCHKENLGIQFVYFFILGPQNGHNWFWPGPNFFSSKITPHYCSGTISKLLIFFIFINILNYIPDSGGRPLVQYNNKFINFNQFNINYVGPDRNLNIIQQRGVVAPW